MIRLSYDNLDIKSQPYSDLVGKFRCNKENNSFALRDSTITEKSIIQSVVFVQSIKQRKIIV